MSQPMENRNYFKQFTNIMSSKNSPTSILALNPEAAKRIYEMAERLGLKIPDEFSVVCIGDSNALRTMEPSLTTASVSLDEIGLRGTKRLLELVNNETGESITPTRISIAGTVIEGNSHKQIN